MKAFVGDIHKYGPKWNMERRWFVHREHLPLTYLHTNNQWHVLTRHNGKWTGFYKTRQAARKAARKYNIENGYTN